MKERHNKKEGRLHIVPLILGVYGAFLGFGLMAAGLAGTEDGTVVKTLRFLGGLVMACFGVYGIWDGVRDFVKPDKRPEKPPASPFILTDISGNKSSNVTIELLQEQLRLLAENGDRKNPGFHLQLLQPLPAVREPWRFEQVSCIYQDKLTLVAFFQGMDGEYRTYCKSVEPDMAEEWFKQLLSGRPDFSGWESPEADAEPDETGNCPHEADAEPDETGNCPHQADAGSRGVKALEHLSANHRKGVRTSWHQLLVIFGESWKDEHIFFSARDLELAVEGVHDGKYQKVILQWGSHAFDIFPGLNSELMVIWQINAAGKNEPKVFAKEGTVTQVKFWLMRDLNEGLPGEISGWADITDQVKKEWRKHGKVF